MLLANAPNTHLGIPAAAMDIRVIYRQLTL